MGLPGGAVLGQHAAAVAQGEALMSGSEAWPFSINGQRQAPLVGNSPCQWQETNCPNLDESAAPPRQTSQPGIHGASGANRDASIEGTRRSEERTRGNPEGSTMSRLRGDEQSTTETIPVTQTYISAEGDHGSEERLVQSDAGTAADATNTNVITQGDSSGASDARPGHHPCNEEVPDQRPNQDIDAGGTTGTEQQGNVSLDGASDANRRNQIGASDERIRNNRSDGASDANRAQRTEQPQRRPGRSGRTR